jgi:hypothetical protein
LPIDFSFARAERSDAAMADARNFSLDQFVSAPNTTALSGHIGSLSDPI